MNNSKLMTLAGCCDLRNFDDKYWHTKFSEMRSAGYWGVYLSDIFFIQVSPNSISSSSDRIIFKDPDNWFIERSESELLAIKKLLRETDLSIAGAHFLQVLPAYGNPPEDIYPIHERLLNVAAVMEIPCVTTHIGWRLGSGFLGITNNDEQLYNDSLAVYKHLCEMAKARGIRVTIETACQNWPWLDENPERLIAFIKEVGADNLGICVDSGHCHITGINIPKAICTFGSYFWETHFHDNFGRWTEQFDKCDLHNPVGIGIINWQEIIEAMQKIDYCGVVTFEQTDFLTNVRNWKLFLESAKRIQSLAKE